MEKDHLSIIKVVKIYEINQRSKIWVRVPIAVSLSPAATHIQINFLNYSPFSSLLLLQKYKGKDKEN